MAALLALSALKAGARVRCGVDGQGALAASERAIQGPMPESRWPTGSRGSPAELHETRACVCLKRCFFGAKRVRISSHQITTNTLVST